MGEQSQRLAEAFSAPRQPLRGASRSDRPFRLVVSRAASPQGGKSGAGGLAVDVAALAEHARSLSLGFGGNEAKSSSPGAWDFPSPCHPRAPGFKKSRPAAKRGGFRGDLIAPGLVESSGGLRTREGGGLWNLDLGVHVFVGDMKMFIYANQNDKLTLYYFRCVNLF